MTKIFRISCRCNCCHISGLHAKKQREHRHCDQDDSPLYDVSQITVGDTNVDDLCHLQRNEHFHQYFEDDKDRSQHGLLLVFSDGFKKCLIHLFDFPPYSFLTDYTASVPILFCRSEHPPGLSLRSALPLFSGYVPGS